ncbi:unnamed protein product, partial [Mesorhabditis belari]|uniref:Structural maintenance of chromosomes protein 2 n=1 Tax=Mesorhabditis belari TaxID=2138241 RepID=A0AAF3F1Q3_9BILA
MQVIVTEGAVSKQLIDTKGALQKRTTFLPLDRIENQVLANQKMQAAKRIARERNEDCWLALDLIKYEEPLSKVMEYVFGTTIICETKETASLITYNREIKTKTVTLEGDTYQPSGSGSGGSRDTRNSVIVAAKSINEYTKLVDQKTKELAQVDEQLQALEPARNKFEQANNRLIEINERVDFLESNVRQSPVQILRTEITELEQELEQITARLKKNQTLMKELAESVKQYEDRKKNAKLFKEQEEKKAKKELKAAEEALAALGAEAERAKEMLAIRREEVATLERQIQDQREQICNINKRGEEIKTTLEEKDELVNSAKEKAEVFKRELDVYREEVRRKNDELKKLAQKIDKSKKELMTEENNREDYRKSAEEHKELAKRFKKQYAEILKDYAWIADIEDQIGAKGTDLEFPNDYSYEHGKKDLESTKERKTKLGRSLNLNGMQILQAAEDNVLNLQKKKEILHADKKTILETIKTLDERKEKEVIRAYEKVTKEFGNIFTTLLPGAEAKLQPPSGKTALDGLEVKVGFNGKWKESLGELSGGQRSLVALSLVLAMLKFKPAPLYILDEVDAALDLAHTQNIGTMIKKHFTNSQFIIVSLKEGMFNNANVLFRTKFQDGTSQVERYVNK